MEDDRLKEFFEKFSPDLKPDRIFLSDLDKRIEMIEEIRKENVELRRRCRIAVSVATLCGFIAGFIFCMLLPTIEVWVGNLKSVIPQASVVYGIVENHSLLAWILIASGICLISVNAYQLSMALLVRSQSGY